MLVLSQRSLAFDCHQITKFKLFTLLDRPDSTEIRRFINMMKCLIDLCTNYSSEFVLHMFISDHTVRPRIYISLLKFKLMILKFALTETFSANICNICITSIIYVVSF